MNAALYMRVSSDRQAKEGDSLPAQREALRKYAKEHKYTIVGEYIDDGVSGTKYAERDEMQRLLSDLSRIDIILVTKFDRLFRSVKWYLQFWEECEKHNTVWLAIWEPIYDTSTPQGRLIIHQMLSIAQFEAENTGARIRAVQAYKLSQGEVISGMAPPGYRIENKHLIPSENAHAVLFAYELYSRCGNLNQVCLELGGRDGLPRTKPSMKHVLTNPIYIGTHPSGQKDFCPPIVPMDLWEDVQRKIRMNIKSSQKETYIFSGLIRCADCGLSFAANTRRRKRGNSLSVIHQYRCPGHYMRKPPQCGNAKMLTETALERLMIAEFKRQMGEIKLSYEIGEQKKRDLKKEISAVEKKITRLKDLYLAELIDLDEYRADKTALQERLEALQNEEGKAPKEIPAEWFSPSLWEEYDKFDRSERRRFWRGIVDRIEFGKDREMDVIFL